MMMEKALPAKRRRAAKGTVLFTVVAVMMVLIVFLMGTLALAATANKRAQRNYQKEQTEYTARAVLDSVIQKINEDTTGTGLKRDIADGTVSSLTVTIDDGSPNPPTQTVNIQKLMNGTNEVTRGIYTGATDGWKDVPLYMLSVNIASSTTSAETTYTALVTAGLRTSTGSGGGGGGGGAFVAMGQLTGDLGTGGYITGGSFINVDNIANGILGNYSIGTVGGGTTIDAPVYIYGNVTTGSKTNYVRFSNEKDFFGIEGDFTPSDAGFSSDFGDADTFGWTTTPTPPAVGTVAYENIPVFYVGGHLNSLNSKFTMGSTDVPVRIYSGYFDLGNKSDGGVNIHGDLYGTDPDKESHIFAAGCSKLYSWTKRNIDGQANNHLGNIYTAGDLVLGLKSLPDPHGNAQDVERMEIEGGVYCAKKLTLTGRGTNKGYITIKGDVVVGDELIVPSNTVLKADKIIAGKITNNGIIECTSAAYLDYSGVAISTGTAIPVDKSTLHGTNTHQVKKWYSDVTYDIEGGNYNGGGAYFTRCNVSYKVHTIEDGGAEQVSDFITSEMYPPGNNINMNPYASDPHINANPPIPYNFLMDNSPIFKEVNTNTSEATAIDETTGDFSIAEYYGKDIYPSQYAKNKLPDALYKIPAANTYRDNYITKREKLDKSIYDGGYKVPVITSTTTTQPGGTATANSYTTDNFIEINNSCVLTGKFNKGNIYINPSTASAMTVVLDNFSMDEDGGAGKNFIIVNDNKAPVYFYVYGTCELKCTGIITTDYLDLFCGAGNWSLKPPAGQQQGEVTFSNALTIHEEIDITDPAQDVYLPKVYIYGDENNSVLNLDGNNVVVTAQIRAPEMQFHQKMGKGADIKYVRASGATKEYNSGDNTCIGVIGQLIAKQVTLDNSAKWGMIYVTEKDNRCAACKAANCTSCTGAAGCTCSCAGCAYHTTPPPPSTPSGSVNFAENFNVLYYSVY